MRKFWNVLFYFLNISVVVTFLFFATLLPASAMELTLTWNNNEENDLAGYKVYCDINPNIEEDFCINTFFEIQYDLDGLIKTVSIEECPFWINLPISNIHRDQENNPICELILNTPDNFQNYYFVVSAYDMRGLESFPSNVVDTVGLFDSDNCPNDPAKTEPGVCGCGVADTDSDNDGTADCLDNCPDDPAKIEPGICGCGVADTGSDSDSTADCLDLGFTTCGVGECQVTIQNYVDGQMQTCIPGNPNPEVCDGLDNDCDGSTDENFNLQTDIQNCGDCGNVCSYPHAAADCINYECVMVSCNEGWEYSDGNPGNGCEHEIENGGDCVEWEAMIIATGQEAGDAARVSNSIIGMATSADTMIAPGASPEYTVRMRIKDPDTNQYYGKDIRECSEDEYWVLRVQVNDDYADPGLSGYYPVLSWNPDDFSPDLKYSLRLGNTGRGTRLVTDMRTVSEYQILDGDGEYFSISESVRWSEDVTIEQSLNKGWNMSCFGMLPDIPTVEEAFPDQVALYEFNPQFGYLPLNPGDNLEVGVGYWVNLPEAKVYEITGEEIDYISTNLAKGWSLIGGMTCPSKIQSQPGQIAALYKFDPAFGYFPVDASEDDLEPGLAYWINLTAESQVDYACSTSTVSRMRASIEAPPQNIAWERMILFTGQEAGDAVRVSNVFIGQSDTADSMLAPDTPPDYTVRARIKDAGINTYYGKDIRAFGSESEIWIIRVDINDDTADIAGPGYYPLIEWDFSTLENTKFELRHGDSGDGELLVDNMESVSCYQTTVQDVVSDTRQWFTITWHSCMNTATQYENPPSKLRGGTAYGQLYGLNNLFGAFDYGFYDGPYSPWLQQPWTSYNFQDISSYQISPAYDGLLSYQTPFMEAPYLKDQFRGLYYPDWRSYSYQYLDLTNQPFWDTPAVKRVVKSPSTDLDLTNQPFWDWNRLIPPGKK